MFACPECQARLPRRRRREIWVEFPVANGYVAAYRMVAKHRRPVLAEVRVFPDEPRRGPGRWSEEARSVPAGGLPAGALTALRLKDPLTLFPEITERLDQESGGRFSAQLLQRFGFGSMREVPRRPGRAGRPDIYYALWADAYVERLRGGSRTPVKDLVAKPPVVMDTGGGISIDAVRDVLAEARRRDLLSPAPVGRAGGDLTPKAERLIRQASHRRSAR